MTDNKNKAAFPFALHVYEEGTVDTAPGIIRDEADLNGEIVRSLVITAINEGLEVRMVDQEGFTVFLAKAGQVAFPTDEDVAAMEEEERARQAEKKEGRQ